MWPDTRLDTAVGRAAYGVVRPARHKTPGTRRRLAPVPPVSPVPLAAHAEPCRPHPCRTVTAASKTGTQREPPVPARRGRVA